MIPAASTNSPSPVYGEIVSLTKSTSDVYKRQVMDQFILRIMDIVNGYDSNIMKEQTNEWYWRFYQRFAENSDFFVSVSYTHLDVYKRQVLADAIP